MPEALTLKCLIDGSERISATDLEDGGASAYPASDTPLTQYLTLTAGLAGMRNEVIRSRAVDARPSTG